MQADAGRSTAEDARLRVVRAPQAALIDESDPAAATAARVVPSEVRKLSIGQAVIGYFAEPIRLVRKKSGTKPNWTEIAALQRLNELGRLVAFRIRRGDNIGNPDGWASVLADTAAALGKEVDVASVNDLCRRIGLLDIDPAKILAAVHGRETARRVWRGYRVMSPEAAGAAVELTTAERSELRIRRLDAWDEPAEERKRRIGREKKARQRRAKGAMPREQFIAQSLAAAKPWDAEGMSRSAWYRKRAREAGG
ncbi:hypothetical protein ACFQU1_04915 [Chelatococcus sp. GCM10030263]|uniref:hypothetical protein n=1 Tax=Chelatococcus sp. GCM10030263 TaxID=3273387 RepID=UPI003623BD0F